MGAEEIRRCATLPKVPEGTWGAEMNTIAEMVARVRQAGIDTRAAGGRPRGPGNGRRGKPTLGKPSKRALAMREGEKAKDGVVLQ